MRLGLISHDKGGLTERDMKMAQALNETALDRVQLLTERAARKSTIFRWAGGVLAHLGQGSAVPDRDRNPAESRRGGEQQACAPEIAALRGGRTCAIPVRTKGIGDLKGMGMDNLRKGMDDLIKKCRERGFEGNFFAKPAFMLVQGPKLRARKIQESG